MKQIIICDLRNIFEISKFCESNNFDVNIDQFSVPDFLEKSPNAIDEHQQIYKNVNIYSIHGSKYDLNIGSRDSLIREVTLKRYESTYEISEKLKCKNIIFHNGYVPGTTSHSSWVKRAKVFWNKFLRNKPREVNFYIENLVEHNPDIIIDVVNSVNSKNLKVCFDIGHANIFSKVEIITWIEKMNSNIGFVHLHNNFGIKDVHFGLGNGVICMKEICIALEHYCPESIWAIET